LFSAYKRVAMKTTDCSHCGQEVEVRPGGAEDTMFSWECTNCGEWVLLDGNAKEQQQRNQAKRAITAEIQELAAEIDTPGYEPAPYSVEKLKEELERILDEAESELERRRSR
jgi:predicted RNA-binding Zn-ribbon protein involved in translation (DUF1610 family)